MLLLFQVLLVVQCVVVVLHDVVEIPGWTHGSQVRAAIGGKFWAATAVNAVFPLTAVVVVLFAWGSTSFFARNYPWMYCAITVLSAIGMWYVPYVFGASETTKREYAAMYAGTRQVLPARRDHPRPNLLHVLFHVLFLMTLALSLALRFHR